MAIKQPIEKNLVQQSLEFQFATQTESTIVHLELQVIDPSQDHKNGDPNLTWTSGHSREAHIIDSRELDESSKTLSAERNLSGLHSRKGSATNLTDACQM
jgi:hypothetical protein